MQKNHNVQLLLLLLVLLATALRSAWICLTADTVNGGGGPVAIAGATAAAQRRAEGRRLPNTRLRPPHGAASRCSCA